MLSLQTEWEMCSHNITNRLLQIDLLRIRLLCPARQHTTMHFKSRIFVRLTY